MRSRALVLGAMMGMASVAALSARNSLSPADLVPVALPSTGPMPKKSRGIDMRTLHSRGTFTAGRNTAKRKARAEVAQLKGQPGGWKKALRIWQEVERQLRRGVPVEQLRLRSGLSVEKLQRAKRVLAA